MSKYAVLPNITWNNQIRRWEIDRVIGINMEMDRIRHLTSTLYAAGCNGLVKFGFSKDFETRRLQIRGSGPYPITKVAIRTVPMAGVRYAGQWLHREYKDKHVTGEWFSIPESEAIDGIKRAAKVAVQFSQWREQYERDEREFSAFCRRQEAMGRTDVKLWKSEFVVNCVQNPCIGLLEA